MSKGLLFAGAAFAVTLAVYFPSVRYEFVGFDDPDYVLTNEHIKDGLTAAGVKWALTDRGYASNWHPLCWMSLMADVSLLDRVQGGQRDAKPEKEWCKMLASPWVDGIGRRRLSGLMHLHNAALHAANAALLFLLMSLILRGRIADFWLLGLTLLWALHPLRVEVVCWVTERKELLSVFFMLLTLIAYIGRKDALYLLSLAFFALALLAKPVAVTLPAVLFAWDWAYRRKVPWLKILPFAALSAMTCLFTMQSQTESLESGQTMDVAGRLSSVFVAPLVYVRETFWPTGLTFINETPDALNVAAFAAGVVLVLAMMGVCLIWLWRRTTDRHGPAALDVSLDLSVFGIAWVYVGLLPMLGIVKVGCQFHNDRYTYWIGCGVAVVVAMALPAVAAFLRRAICRIEPTKAGSEWLQTRKAALVVMGIALVVVSVLTAGQMSCWRNSLVLFRDAMPKSLNTEVAWALAGLLNREGPEGRAEAEMWLRESVNHRKNQLSLGNLAEFLLTKQESSFVQRMTGKAYGEAEDIIEEMLSADPDDERAKKLKKRLEELRKKLEG